MLNKDNALLIKKQLENASKELLNKDALYIRTANKCMEDARTLPPMKQLWGQLFQTGEVAFLAGDTGLGKSILGVCIADAISRGNGQLLGLPVEEKLSVLLIDIELSDRQFNNRYEGYQFSDLFYRATINPYAEIDDLTFTFDQFKKVIDQVDAKVIILDNITALSLKSTQDVDVALLIMRGLKKLAIEGKSILVLTHIPKTPKLECLTNNNLAGSKYLSFFADSIVFIAQSSQNSNFRYIKQTKCRNAEMLLDVMILNLEKTDNFLGFEFVGFDSELNHLGSYHANREELKSKTKVLRQSGMSIRNIAKELGVSKSAIERYINDTNPKTKLIENKEKVQDDLALVETNGTS